MPLQLLRLEVCAFPPLSLCACLLCAAAGAVETCWLITFGRTGLLTMRNCGTVATNVASWFHLSVFIMTGAVPKPNFTKQFCIMAGMMDLHAMTSVIWHFLMSSVSTSSSISHNRRCTTFLQYTGFVQYDALVWWLQVTVCVRLQVQEAHMFQGKVRIAVCSKLIH
jgi:hypothetical protein